MDQVFIRGISARGIIGVYEWERVSPQEIRIDLELISDLCQAGESDRIEDCINYDTLASKVHHLAETAARQTVEALAADIAKLSLKEPRVQRVRVRVEKPGAVRFTTGVGVEIERSREDFT